MNSREIPDHVWRVYAPALGIVAVILYYALFLYRHALNIPFADDIRDVVLFLTHVAQSTNWERRFEPFFTQLNEHRTLSSRLFYYALLNIEGEINFRSVLFVANMALPLLFLMLFLALRRNSHALLILLPVGLVLFQLRFYEISFWSMSAFAYMYVYVFAFASLSCLREVNAERFLAALLFASLGTFTLASGQLIWLVGLASLLHQSLILRRASLGYVICWVLCAVIVLLVWRIGYETHIAMSMILQDTVARPLHYVSYFLVLLGNAASQHNVWLAGSVGAVLLLVVSYASVRNFAREDILLELFGGYIILSIIAMTLGRAPLSMQTYALSSRYSFPSVLLLATTIAIVGSRMPSRWRTVKVYTCIAVLAAVYWVSSFQMYSVNLQLRLENLVANYNWGHYWEYGVPAKESNASVQAAVALGIYVPPPRPHPTPEVARSVQPD